MIKFTLMMDVNAIPITYECSWVDRNDNATRFFGITDCREFVNTLAAYQIENCTPFRTTVLTKLVSGNMDQNDEQLESVMQV